MLTSNQAMRCLGLAVLYACCCSAIALGQNRAVTGNSGDRALEGVLQPYEDREVATTEVGIVREVLVKPGDRVVKDQPLAILDSNALLAQIRVKEREALARGKLEQAKEEVKYHERKVQQLADLKKKGFAPALELERAEADLLIAQGRLAAEEDQNQIQELELLRFRQQLADRTIRAPAEGIVTEIFKITGEFVAANSPNIVRIVDVRKLKATFPVPESELVGIEVGKKLRIQLSGGKIVEGIVEFVPPVADASSGWFMITVVIDNLDEKIIGSRCQRVP